MQRLGWLTLGPMVPILFRPPACPYLVSSGLSLLDGTCPGLSQVTWQALCPLGAGGEEEGRCRPGPLGVGAEARLLWAWCWRPVL